MQHMQEWYQLRAPHFARKTNLTEVPHHAGNMGAAARVAEDLQFDGLICAALAMSARMGATPYRTSRVVIRGYYLIIREIQMLESDADRESMPLRSLIVIDRLTSSSPTNHFAVWRRRYWRTVSTGHSASDTTLCAVAIGR
jgi:hypothetical protein